MNVEMIRHVLNMAIEDLAPGPGCNPAGTMAMFVGSWEEADKIMAEWESENGGAPDPADVRHVFEITDDALSGETDEDTVVAALGVLLHGAEHTPSAMTPRIAALIARWEPAVCASCHGLVNPVTGLATS